MRKFYLFLCMLMVVSLSKAQSGTFEVGSMAGFWRDGDAGQTTVNFSPDVCYNMTDSWAVGLALEYAYAKQEGETLNRYGVQPYARYTFFTSGVVSFFVDGALGWSSIHPEGGSSGSMFEVGLIPGIAGTLGEKVTIQAKIGFLGYRDVDRAFADTWQNGWGFQLDGNALEFGISYVI